MATPSFSSSTSSSASSSATASGIAGKSTLPISRTEVVYFYGLDNVQDVTKALYHRSHNVRCFRQNCYQIAQIEDGCWTLFVSPDRFEKPGATDRVLPVTLKEGGWFVHTETGDLRMFGFLVSINDLTQLLEKVSNLLRTQCLQFLTTVPPLIIVPFGNIDRKASFDIISHSSNASCLEHKAYMFLKWKGCTAQPCNLVLHSVKAYHPKDPERLCVVFKVDADPTVCPEHANALFEYRGDLQAPFNATKLIFADLVAPTDRFKNAWTVPLAESAWNVDKKLIEACLRCDAMRERLDCIDFENYCSRENERLVDQAKAMLKMKFDDSFWDID